MDEIRTDEEASKAPGMENTEESLKGLEKKYEDVFEKYKESQRDGEKRKKHEKKMPEICLPNRLPRMEVRADDHSSEVASMKVNASLLQSKKQALSSALALGKKKLEEMKEKKSELRRKINVMETRECSRRTKMEMAMKAVEKMKPQVDELERDVTQYEEKQTNMEQNNVKIWEKNRKLVIYQAEANKRKLINEDLEMKDHSLTRRSQELKEICQELNSKEKAAMEKIDICYHKIREEETTAEIDTAYGRKWTKVHESLGHCDRLIEISNLEIQELKDDTPIMVADQADRQEQEPEENELEIVESVDLKPKEAGESPPQSSDSPVIEEIILNDYPLFIDDVTMQDSPMYMEDIARHDSPVSTEDIIDITE
ncbi:tropomyosin beta chain-like [Penaeus chinensis]|uniref:tropomyosin beta chain-like n=1 Tax=Penaeus chinensis TaxID=139456 RepID=UPI001FB7B81C|nr:tropomyosin beta chain-like [Penaeus chinensis]